MDAEISSEDKRRLQQLLRGRRWGALATSRDDEPFASWVAFVVEPDLGGFILHLSRLAVHTRYLALNPRAALSISEPDDSPDADPQQLARVTLQGKVAVLPRGTPDYENARTLYLSRLPSAAQQFGLADFELCRFTPETSRYVPGFGRVFRLGPDELRALAR